MDSRGEDLPDHLQAIRPVEGRRGADPEGAGRDLGGEAEGQWWDRAPAGPEGGEGEGWRLEGRADQSDQGAQSIPISTIGLKDRELTFSVKLIGAKFTGKKNADATAFEGQFEQSGLKMPLTLKKTDKVSSAPRPQTPKPPFPYGAEDVAYENAAGKVKLAGTLTLPPGGGPFPAVVLLTGSGAQDRDETILGHKPFLVLADYLTARGCGPPG